MKNFNTAGRAQAGGEKGVNGDHYKGGQFLPATQAPKGTFTLTAPTPLDDAAQAERAARKARQEVEVTAFQAQCKVVAADPRTIWLATFLTDTFTRPGYQGLRDDGYWYDETHSWEHHTWMENGVQIRKAQVFTNDFIRNMHAELTRYGKFPWELSDRAYGILAEMYAKKDGARRNSKAYNALLDEFETNTLPAEGEA